MVTVSPAVTKLGDGAGDDRLELLAPMGGLRFGRLMPLEVVVMMLDKEGWCWCWFCWAWDAVDDDNEDFPSSLHSEQFLITSETVSLMRLQW